MTSSKVTATQAAAMLSCSRQYVHYLVKRGQLEPSDRVGPNEMLLFEQQAVQELADAREAARSA